MLRAHKARFFRCTCDRNRVQDQLTVINRVNLRNPLRHRLPPHRPARDPIALGAGRLCPLRVPRLQAVQSRHKRPMVCALQVYQRLRVLHSKACWPREVRVQGLDLGNLVRPLAAALRAPLPKSVLRRTHLELAVDWAHNRDLPSTPNRAPLIRRVRVLPAVLLFALLKPRGKVPLPFTLPCFRCQRHHNSKIHSMLEF